MQEVQNVETVDRTQFPDVVLERLNTFIADHQLAGTTSWKMVLKLIVALVWFGASYAAIYKFGTSPVLLVLAYVFHGTAHMFMTFNVAHEANHNTLTNNTLVNKALSYTFDLCGVSSYMWRILHHRGHHFCMNVHGEDEAITYPFFRLSPHAPRQRIHKYQYLYGPVLYGFMTLDYVLAKDFKYFFFSDYSITKDVRHTWKEYVILFLSKAIYLTYMIVLPIRFLGVSPWLVIMAFVAMHYILGLMMSFIFIISHVVDINQFPKANNDFKHFVYHILATTADYSVENPLANFFLGGFNQHVIHHFVPHVSHVHLSHLTKILKTTSEEYGVQYKANKTMYEGWIQHFRHLKRLGQS